MALFQKIGPIARKKRSGEIRPAYCRHVHYAAPGTYAACHGERYRLRCWSELKLERQLDRPRSADLVERVETAIRAAGPEAVRQSLD